MARYAIVKDGVVENVIEWDGVSDWAPPDGYQAIIDLEALAEPKGTHDGKQFVARVKDDVQPAKRGTRSEPLGKSP